MEMHKCEKCGSWFSDEEVAESPGGDSKRWPVSVSPCCLWSYVYVDYAELTEGEYHD